jgi:hypothetical protein
MLADLFLGLHAIGRGLDMVCTSMFPSASPTPPFDTIFFRSDRDALEYDWRCICGDMQAASREMKIGADHVH